MSLVFLRFWVLRCFFKVIWFKFGGYDDVIHGDQKESRTRHPIILIDPSDDIHLLKEESYFA